MVDISIDSHFDAIIIRLENLFWARLSSWPYPVGRFDLVTFNLSRIRTELELSRVKSH